jgi:hypothetical protein
MLQYAGIDLCPKTPILDAVLARWVDEGPELWNQTGWLSSGIDHLPLPAIRQYGKPRLNVLYWPTGASRWACFHSLIGGEQADALITKIDSDSPTRRIPHG